MVLLTGQDRAELSEMVERKGNWFGERRWIAEGNGSEKGGGGERNSERVETEIGRQSMCERQRERERERERG